MYQQTTHGMVLWSVPNSIDYSKYRFDRERFFGATTFHYDRWMFCCISTITQ